MLARIDPWLLVLTALATAPALASPQLDRANAWFKKGRDVDVLTTLRDEGKVPPAETAAAAKLLAASSARALAHKRTDLAEQLAEASFDLDPAQPEVLRFLINGCIDDRHFALARRYLDIWKGVRPGDAKETAEVAARIDTAEHGPSLLSRAQAFFKAKDPSATGGVTSTPTLYGTGWCPACRAARQWLKQQQVSFVDRDVEADPLANAEKVEKARAAGLRTGAIPVFTANGTTLLGFSPEAYSRALGIK